MQQWKLWKTSKGQGKSHFVLKFWLSKAEVRKNPQFRLVNISTVIISNEEFYFLFLNLTAVPKKSIPGKFAYIWRFQQIVRNAEKVFKSQIHFKSDVFAALASPMLKLPNKQSHRKVLLSSFHLNGHTLGFYLGTQKLQLPFTA